MAPQETIAYARQIQKLREAERELTIMLAKLGAGMKVSPSGGGEVRG
jgi:hypothetical protein